MQRDERGLDLTTASAEAAAGFDHTLQSNLEYRTGTAKALKATLAADPEFLMGHCLKGYLFTLFGSEAFMAPARDSLAFCESHQDKATARERAHVAALAALIKGDLRKADLIWGEILTDYPRDLLALRLQHFALFYMGDGAGLRNAIARVLPAWGAEVPGQGFVQGMYGFGLEESGDYAAAEIHGRRGVEANPDDLWAVHGVAHVMEMQGRIKDGIQWLSQPLDCWDDRNAFKEHLWWHRALFHFERADHDEVLRLYDQAVRRDKESDFYLNLVNCAALLWRLRFQGVEVGDRWEELAEMCAARIGDHVLVFSDLHFAMGLAGAGRIEPLERQVESLAAFAETPDNFGATTVHSVGLPICQAILAYAKQDYDQAVELLLPVRRDWGCMGGSHAQRDIFSQFLIEAALAAKRFPLARSLLAERVALKPNSAGSWLKYAEALTALDDLAGAEGAQAERKRVLAN